MKLLAIDTATEALSVALDLDGEIIERFEVAGREHSTRLPKMLQALLADAGLALSQIDGLIAGVGPGSFAGVRIGVAFVKGLALGLDRPTLGASSLRLLAQGAHRMSGAEAVMAAIDARMSEVYAGAFVIREGLAVAALEEQVAPPGAVRFPAMQGAMAVGTGWAAARETLLATLQSPPLRIVDDALPHARDALDLLRAEFAAGRGRPGAELAPNYLRNRVALTQTEQTAAREARNAR